MTVLSVEPLEHIDNPVSLWQRPSRCEQFSVTVDADNANAADIYQSLFDSGDVPARNEPHHTLKQLFCHRIELRRTHERTWLIQVLYGPAH